MSKSGSKALSKSVDSAVKSVESVVSSVLPKNMNMKHVLLAILVGLLLCMLMGNTVEGFTRLIAPADGKSISDYECPDANATVVPLVAGDDDGDGNGAIVTGNSEVGRYGCVIGTRNPFGNKGASSWGQAPRLRNQATRSETDPQGNTLTDGCGSPPSGNAPTGLCKPTLDASPADEKACYSEGQTGGSTVCGTSPNTENCEWIDKTTYNNNGLLTGDALNMLLQNLNIKKYQCSDDSSNLNFGTDAPDGGGDKNLAEITNTKLLPIMGIIDSNTGNVISADSTQNGQTDRQTGRTVSLTQDPAWKKLSDPQNESAVGPHYKDLLYYLFKDSGKWDSLKTETEPTKWVGAINQSDKIPNDLKDTLSLTVGACADAWNNDTLKEIYPHNGGRPIIGIDKHAGAVCRNTPYKPKVDVINEWRLHVGEGCPGSVSADGKNIVNGGDKLTCGSESDCNARKGLEAAVMSQNPFSVNNRCSLKKCRDSAKLCPTQNLTDFTGSMLDNGINQLKDTFGIPFV